tara:strand:- start:2719 stop:3603 length:885 start_codon:yes stop_codon:yes gene_type:complete
MSRLTCKERVTMDDLNKMKTPPPTATHFPLSHYEVLSEQLDQLDACGYEWKNLEIGVSHKNMRCFWIMDIENPTVARDWNSVWGGRNSHDKTFALLFLAGLGIWICSNLQVTGEIQVGSKHTKHIGDRLKRMVTRGLFELTQFDAINEDRIAAYESYSLPEEEYEIIDMEKPEVLVNGIWTEKRKFESSSFINDFVVRSMDRGVISPSSIKLVLDEWREPKFDTFEPRNAWSLSNAYTEAFKKYSNPHQIFNRGIALTSMIDELVGFEAPALIPSPEDIDIDVVKSRRRETILN